MLKQDFDKRFIDEPLCCCFFHGNDKDGERTTVFTFVTTKSALGKIIISRLAKDNEQDLRKTLKSFAQVGSPDLRRNSCSQDPLFVPIPFLVPPMSSMKPFLLTRLPLCSHALSGSFTVKHESIFVILLCMCTS